MTSSTPEISVVIPSYNYAHLILESLESAFAQTFTDYEVIVIDDGSTDNTREILKPYDGRITYHYQQNQGIAAARNTGTRLARGKYITYLDADDIWHPDNLRIKHEILSRYPELGGVFSDFLIFSASGVSHPRGTKELYPFFRRTGMDFKDMFQQCGEVSLDEARTAIVYRGNVFDSLFWGNFILPTTMLVNRSFVLKAGDFRPHMRNQEDYEYWLRFARHHSLAYVDEVLAQYRRHPQQNTDHSKIEQMISAVLEIIDAYEEEFRRNGRLRVFNRRKAEILANLAKVHVRQGTTSQARALYRDAIRLNPAYREPYIHYLLSFVPYRWLRAVRNLVRK